MILNDELTEKIKQISIRGRLAFGATCLEQYIKENYLEGEWLDELLETLWEFTISNKLNEWDDKISDFENELRIQSLDADFILMIKQVIQIGTGNLYLGTETFSPSTLQSTLELIQIAIEKLNNIPKIEDFEFSQISQHHGWGKRFDRAELEKNTNR